MAGRVSVSGKGADKRNRVGEWFESQPKDRVEREDMWRNSGASVHIRHYVSFDNDMCMLNSVIGKSLMDVFWI